MMSATINTWEYQKHGHTFRAILSVKRVFWFVPVWDLSIIAYKGKERMSLFGKETMNDLALSITHCYLFRRISYARVKIQMSLAECELQDLLAILPVSEKVTPLKDASVPKKTEPGPFAKGEQ